MKLALVAAAAAFLTAVSLAHAQAPFPSKTVRLIVPVVPGSFTDVAARALAGELAASLGHPVVVDNRPGAGTTLGTAVVAQAEPDGHTLLVTENSFTISPALYPKLPFDTANDFAPVTLVAEAPYILWARTDLGVNTVKELVEMAKAKPGFLTFASGGQGTSSHLSAELFFEKTGISVVHVPFKGVGASMTEVIAGRGGGARGGGGWGVAGVGVSRPASAPSAGATTPPEAGCARPGPGAKSAAR